MSAYADDYEAEEGAFFEDFETADELRLPFRPGRKISVKGTGLTSATLNTPKGPARLSLPAAVATVTQFRQLEAALNAQTQRMNALQADLVRVRRELATRRGDQTGMGALLPLLMQKKLREEFEEHTHPALDARPAENTSTSSSMSSLLPLLLLAPNMFGGSGGAGTPGTAGTSGSGGSEMSPLLMLMVFGDLF